MADEPRPLPARTVLRFGSLDFIATGNGYDMELLPPTANPDTPAPPPQRRRRSGQRARQARMERRTVARLSSPTWVETGVPPPVAAVEDATSSPPKATVVPPEENAAKPLFFSLGKRTLAATYASTVSTNMSVYEDLPGNHLISIWNLIASSPDSPYPDSTDEGYIFVRGRVAPEWDYSGLRDREAFLLFQAVADFCLTCSDDSSEGDYDPTRECFIVELEE